MAVSRIARIDSGAIIAAALDERASESFFSESINEIEPGCALSKPATPVIRMEASPTMVAFNSRAISPTVLVRNCPFGADVAVAITSKKAP